MNQKLIEREIFKELQRHLLEKEVSVIVGARQTGKTTLLNQLADWLVASGKAKEPQIRFFNLDLIADMESIRDQSDFVRFLQEELEREKFLFVFIDEIQRLESPGKFLKGIYDLNMPIKFVVTGSSSLEIKSKIFESLTGRKRVFHLWPFSFSESLLWHDPGLLNLTDKKDISSLNKKKILNYLFEFIVFGGYPRVVLSRNKDDKINVLNEIYSSYIEKDIAGFMKIKNPFTFSKLISLLGDQAGNLLNSKEISNTLAINFRTTESYLSALENTFVINLIRPYFTNSRKELTKMPKIYFTDNGLRNLSVKYFADFPDSRDKGKLLENFVLTSLLKEWYGTINYWRTKDKNEVDFILKDYFGHVIPLEVKAMEMRKAEIGKGLKSFIERYKPQMAIVVNLSLKENIKVKDTIVRFTLPYMIEGELKSKK